METLFYILGIIMIPFIPILLVYFLLKFLKLKLKYTVILFFVFPVITLKEEGYFYFNIAYGYYCLLLYDLLYGLLFYFKNIYFSMNKFVVYYSLFFSLISTLYLYNLNISKALLIKTFSLYKYLFIVLIIVNIPFLVNQILDLQDYIKELHNYTTLLYHNANALTSERPVYYNHAKVPVNSLNIYFFNFNLYFSIIYALAFFVVLLFIFKKNKMLKNKIILLLLIFYFPIISIKNRELTFDGSLDSTERSIITYPLAFSVFVTTFSYYEDNVIKNENIKLAKENYYYEEYYNYGNNFKNSKYIKIYSYLQILFVLLFFPSLLISKSEENAE